MRLCAAVGAPDAYAGELPVAFVTLAEEARITEAELLAHAAATVDEGPARPRRVIVLEQMPMTNVGKIYKPDLRRLAVAVSVQALVAQSLRESGLPRTALPARADRRAAAGRGTGPAGRARGPAGTAARDAGAAARVRAAA